MSNVVFTVPRGLGLGVNSERLPDPTAGWHQAVGALRPAWTHSWGRLAVGPNYMPSIFPESSGIVPAAQLTEWASRMAAAGYKFQGLTWQICNEPWCYYQITPRDLIDLVKAQDREFRRANLKARYVFPNENTNGGNFDRFREYFQEARQERLLVTPGAHFWEKGQHLLDTIDNFFDWWAGYGYFSVAMPIVVTECGPGRWESMDTWLQTMPTMYALLDKRHPVIGAPMVAALAPFAAYPKEDAGVERHPGLMLPDGALTALGQQYVAERTRRYRTE